MEAALEKEELQLEKLRDSLKGLYTCHLCGHIYAYHVSRATGKTERFSFKIEALQTDLQPWEAQIVQKRAELDLASSKRDMLADKNQGVETGIKEAEDLIQKLALDHTLKVQLTLRS